MNPQHTGSKPAVSAVGLRSVVEEMRLELTREITPTGFLVLRVCHFATPRYNLIAEELRIATPPLSTGLYQRNLNFFLGKLSAFWCLERDLNPQNT